jgi:hypothetical protein
VKQRNGDAAKKTEVERNSIFIAFLLNSGSLLYAPCSMLHAFPNPHHSITPFKTNRPRLNHLHRGLSCLKTGQVLLVLFAVFRLENRNQQDNNQCLAEQKKTGERSGVAE